MDKIHLDNNQIPLHYQIADYLLVLLQKGDINPEKKLPTEEKLTEIFSVWHNGESHWNCVDIFCWRFKVILDKEIKLT